MQDRHWWHLPVFCVWCLAWPHAMCERLHATDEMSESECSADPVGTCRFFGCSASDGPKECRNGQCFCADGYCANEQTQCLKPGKCSTMTPGTCRFFKCFETRGITDCVNGRCVCKPGYCAKDGVCELSASVVCANVSRIASGATFPEEHSHVKTALCFSGGGSRSLSLTIGALRALEQMGLMRSVDAISAVSGGSWATSVYMFADLPMIELLGHPTTPEAMDTVALYATPGRLGQAATQRMGPSLLRMVAEGVEAHHEWTWFVGQTFLAPFGLDAGGKFLAGSEKQVRQIKEMNPALAKESFFVPVLGRPKVFIMLGCVLGPEGYVTGLKSVRSLQMSPDWSGTPFLHGDSEGNEDSLTVSYTDLGGSRETDLLVGGGFIETFAFGSRAPARETAGVQCMKAATKPFSLATAVGISSAAFASYFSNTRFLNQFAPTIRLWPVEDAGMPRQGSVVHEAGDGGTIDSTGILPLMQRGAKKIAWWINTDVGVTDAVDAFCPFAGRPPSEIEEYLRNLDPNRHGNKLTTNQMTDKFGWGIVDAKQGFLANNQVFSKEDYMIVGCELQKLKIMGKPLVYRKSLNVVKNDFWGIQGDWEVDVTFVYNEWCEDFVSLLPPETMNLARYGRNGWGALKHFPFIKTVFQNIGEAISLTNAQVNLLSTQSEYYVHQNEDLFRDLLTS
eukprot:TRINITY_DN12846_c0_g1_i2.p1 TRINITY_DN12846_c0_g1~~TRINITY_DN12846_c0_g1_i2.p1  ORF type:complete len:678 (+),score=89.50 TRINITY_DN12846_c0_g1_i2:74-2107(+)